VKKEVVSLSQKNIERKLDAMILSLSDARLRWLIGKGKSIIDQGKITPEEYETVIKDILQTEMQRKMIVWELAYNTLTANEISSRVKLSSKQVMKHLLALRREGKVTITGERDDELEFQRLGTPLDALNLLSLPEELRTTASAILKLGRATVESVAEETGKEKAFESMYLERLVEMGYLKIEQKDQDLYFYA
jgi:DNA-binding transcriptional ArsR family regulator